MARERKIKRCYQIVARTPQVILATGENQDFTHLQQCGAPVTNYGKCAGHQDMTHDGIERRWSKHVRQMNG